ncbi:MAG: hypothetical protein V5A36_07260 [Natronomonas sp.]
MDDPDSSEASVFRTGGYRWITAVVGFTAAVCLLIVVSVLVLHLASEYGGRVTGSERLGNLLAIGLFVSLIAVPTYLLAVVADSA